jgi:hypothetical protein
MKLNKIPMNYIFIFIAFCIIVIIPMILSVILYYTTKFEKTITIKEKFTRYRRKGSNYNIVDTDNNIYQIGNVWFKFDFNRAEDYTKLELNKTYKVKGYGIRMPVLDMYKTIYHIENN